MFLRRIKLENLLSFGKTELDLLPLNVLIGANASGKSNLIRAIHLLRTLPKNGAAIGEGGGIREWINKRTEGIASLAIWTQAIAASGNGNPHGSTELDDPEYEISLRAMGQDYEIPREVLKGAFNRIGSRVNMAGESAAGPLPTVPAGAPGLSVFRSLREPKVWNLAERLDSIRLYREFQTGPGTTARTGISVGSFKSYLSEDGGNLAAMLDKMDHLGEGGEVNRYLQRFYDGFSEAHAYSEGGILQTFVREKGLSAKQPISAVGLSDGTLRLLCLLVILLNPEPPPLLCIEEPETGLHPDATRIIAELLVKASERTQLIVTTHSPALVDALSDQLEAIVVCERDFDGFTQLRRLKSSDLDDWLEKYSLGQLWQKGEIGGNRW